MNADSLPILLRSLELTAMERECEGAIVRAEAENWGYRRLLQYLTEAEVQDRRTRKIERLLKSSGLPPSETFARFDEAKMPEKARRMLPTLRSGDFVRRGDNLVAIGLPGRGKTGFCAALARELLERHELKVLFVPAFKLAARLLAAKRDLKLIPALAKLNRFDIVLVDELGGYVDFTQGEVDVLFSFFGERYEKQRSVFVTTNLAFGEWEKVFKNPMTATAVVDRLVHRCVLLEFPAKRSIREEDAKKRQASV
jgi:DNA replication protein DnaC